jgi:deazaflavin-dependent oxidoreductase (nitroreductase family)
MYRVIGLVGTSRVVTRLHPRAYRISGGRGVIGRNFGVQNVIVAMTGRRSGRLREVPLYAFSDGDRYVVIGSNAGGDREPAWVANLRADPRATLRVGRQVQPVEAKEATGEERDRLWSLAAAAYPGFEVYRRMTARPIPVIVLAPTAPAPRPSPGAMGT